MYPAATMICQRLGIELEEIRSWTCCGAGVMQEKNQLFGDVLNARTLAKAERAGMTIMTICSTCQGVMSQANKRMLDAPDYLAEINTHLAEEGLEYRGTAQVKHLLWILLEDYGLDKLEPHLTPLSRRPAHRPLLWVLHRPPHRGAGHRGAPGEADLAGDSHRDIGRDGSGFRG